MILGFATQLDAQRRGDPFDYSSVLTGGWLQSMFMSFAFTLRTTIPPTSQHDETDPYVPGTVGGGSFVDQALSSAGDITFSDTTNFRVFLPSTRTTNWPSKRLYWDFVGTLDTGHSYTIDAGSILIVGDVKRAP